MSKKGKPRYQFTNYGLRKHTPKFHLTKVLHGVHALKTEKEAVKGSLILAA